MDENDKEAIKFILQAIEKLSLALLMNDYNPEEMHQLNQQAGIHLYDYE